MSETAERPARRKQLPPGATPPENARWRSINEAAKRLGISRRQVYNLMADSLLRYQTMPPHGRRRIHDDEIDRFMGVR